MSRAISYGVQLVILRYWFMHDDVNDISAATLSTRSRSQGIWKSSPQMHRVAALHIRQDQRIDRVHARGQRKEVHPNGLARRRQQRPAATRRQPCVRFTHATNHHTHPILTRFSRGIIPGGCCSPLLAPSRSLSFFVFRRRRRSSG